MFGGLCLIFVFGHTYRDFADDLADLADDGRIKVSCEFCRRDYYFDEEGHEVSI